MGVYTIYPTDLSFEDRWQKSLAGIWQQRFGLEIEEKCLSLPGYFSLKGLAAAKNISCMFFYKYIVLKDLGVNLDPYIYVPFYSAVSRSLSIQPIILLLSSAYSALLRELKI